LFSTAFSAVSQNQPLFGTENISGELVYDLTANDTGRIVLETLSEELLTSLAIGAGDKMRLSHLDGLEQARLDRK